MKAFAKPPRDVKMVMDAVCVLFGIAPSWEASRKFLADTKALEKLMTYDKDNVDVSLFVFCFLFLSFEMSVRSRDNQRQEDLLQHTILNQQNKKQRRVIG